MCDGMWTSLLEINKKEVVEIVAYLEEISWFDAHSSLPELSASIRFPGLETDNKKAERMNYSVVVSLSSRKAGEVFGLVLIFLHRPWQEEAGSQSQEVIVNSLLRGFLMALRSFPLSKRVCDYDIEIGNPMRSSNFDLGIKASHSLLYTT